MKESSQTPRLRERRLGLSWATAAAGHASGVLLVAIVMTLLVVPANTALAVIKYGMSVPDVRAMSMLEGFIHIGLAACLWTLLVVIYKLVMLRRAEGKKLSMHVARGSVMAETVIVLPIFFLLTFGMSQLAINNIAGILANVAVYEAARSAWVWQPEAAAGRMGVSNEIATDRARIAAAMVMTPVAPGEFINTPTGLSSAFRNQRKAMALAHIPFGDAISSYIPGIALDAVASSRTQSAREANLTMPNALDNSSFLVRSIAKFTHAYHASTVEITSGDRITAKLTYRHNQVMPIVGRVFADGGALGTSFNEVGLRIGRYSTITREYSFMAQKHPPNGQPPNNGWFSGDSFQQSGGVGAGDLKGAL